MKFEELISESGHSVLHIMMLDIGEIGRVIEALNYFGCGVNGPIGGLYLVIDVPPHRVYSNIKQYLKEEEDKKILNYQEACISEFHKSRLM